MSQESNRLSPELFIQDALIGLGVHPGNIRCIVPSLTKWQPRPNRYAVIFNESAGLSANQVNAAPGLSNAVFDGRKLVVDYEAVSE